MAWNRPTSNTVDATSSSRPSGRGKMPRLRRGLIAGAIVVLGAGLAAWLLLRGEAASSPLQKKDRGLIKEVKPAAVVQNVETQETEKAQKPDPYMGLETYRDKDGILRFKGTDCRAYDPTRPTMKTLDLGAKHKRVFKHVSEQAIASLLKAKPGGMRFFTPDYSDPFYAEDFEESLADPTPINDDDPPGIKRLKQAVAEAKDEIARRVGKGEKFVDIMKSTTAELRRLDAYRNTLRKEIGDIIDKADGEISDADARDYIKAANAMLEEKGIAPITADDITHWRVRITSEKGDDETQLENERNEK